MDHPRMTVSPDFLAIAFKNQAVVFDKYGNKKEINISEKKPTEKVDPGVSGNIVAICLSNSGQYLVASNDYKQVVLFNTGTWGVISEWTIPKKSMKFLFQNNEKAFLMADKFGEVFTFRVNDPSPPALLLGHFSMVLDLQLLADETFLATCDRDEKIRVSHYPNAYNIQSFCLGHACFVTQLGFISKLNLLVSASADGSLCFWEYRSGSPVSSYDCSADFKKAPPLVTDLLWCEKESVLVVACDNCPELALYRVEESAEKGVSMILSRVIDLGSPFWAVKLLGRHLYVLGPSETQSLTVIPLSESEAANESQELGIISTWSNGVLGLVESLRRETYDTKFYQGLVKNPMDGSASYYTRKRQRIEGLNAV